jgi:hypothetical protein
VSRPAVIATFAEQVVVADLAEQPIASGATEKRVVAVRAADVLDREQMVAILEQDVLAPPRVVEKFGIVHGPVAEPVQDNGDARIHERIGPIGQADVTIVDRIDGQRRADIGGVAIPGVERGHSLLSLPDACPVCGGMVSSP